MNRYATAQPHFKFLESRGAVLDESGQIPLYFTDAEAERADLSVSAALVPIIGSVMRHDGADALDLLHRLSTNELLSLTPGHSVQTVLTSERGRVIDVLNVVMLDSGRLMLLSDAEDPTPALEWIDRFTILEDAVISDATGEFIRFAVIGPSAVDHVVSELKVELEPGRAVSLDETVLVASGWGDSTRVDVVTPVASAGDMWDRLVNVFYLAAGDFAFQAARIEQGIPAPGSELTSDINPLEAGLKHLISFSKGCYIGQEVVARLDTYDKLQKRLAVLEVEGEIDDGMELTSSGKRAGTITSVARLEETEGRRLALGYVRRGYWDVGTKLECGTASVTVRELTEG